MFAFPKLTPFQFKLRGAAGNGNRSCGTAKPAMLPGAASQQLMGLSKDLFKRAMTLRAEVRKFVSTLKAA